jgi:hypothetical protein
MPTDLPSTKIQHVLQVVNVSGDQFLSLPQYIHSVWYEVAKRWSQEVLGINSINKLRFLQKRQIDV